MIDEVLGTFSHLGRTWSSNYVILIFFNRFSCLHNILFHFLPERRSNIIKMSEYKMVLCNNSFKERISQAGGLILIVYSNIECLPIGFPVMIFRLTNSVRKWDSFQIYSGGSIIISI